jgi:hypothetical protein
MTATFHELTCVCDIRPQVFRRQLRHITWLYRTHCFTKVVIMSEEAPPKFLPERRPSVTADAEGLASEDDAAKLGTLAPQLDRVRSTRTHEE